MNMGLRNKYVKYLCLYLLSVILLLTACQTSKNNNRPYLEEQELTYRELTVGETTVEEVLETLGEPFEIYQEKVLEQTSVAYHYLYDRFFADGIFFGLDFIFYESSQTLQRIYINRYFDYPTPYGINISDLLETALDKLPLEPNMKKNISDHMKSAEDYTGLLYGNWSEKTGFGSFSIRDRGRRVDIKLVTPTGLELFILVKNHLVSQIQIGYYNVAK